MLCIFLFSHIILLRVLDKEITKLRARATKLSELEKSHEEVMNKKERYKQEYAKQHEKAKEFGKQSLALKKELKEKEEEVKKLTRLLKASNVGNMGGIITQSFRQ